MNSWTIHSVGDSAFLAEVLTSISMIVGQGDYGQAAKISMLLGAIFVSIKGVIGGARSIDWQHVLVGWIIYTGIFGTTTTVVVEDGWDNSTRVVSEVPYGIAVAGSLIGEMGYQLTDMFEQGFSAPAMSRQGWGNGLETLRLVRQSSNNPTYLSEADVASGGEAYLSVTNYVKSCTTTALTMRETSMSALVRTDKVLDALKFNSAIYGVELNTTGTYVNLPCADGFNVLQSYLKAEFLPQYKEKVLIPALRMPSGTTAAVLTVQIQDALDAIGMNVSADDYILSTFLIKAYYDGAADRARQDQQFDMATALSDAINQRNAQYFADASMFAKIVRPMMSFIESFAYAVVPLMGFLMLLGPLGLMIIGKYVQTLLWVQLWKPILAVVNLYMYYAVSGKMQALSQASNSFSGSSFEGVFKSSDIIDNWLGIGQNLAAATPVLSLMLVYGGSVVASSLANKLGKGDHFDEKKTEPDTLSRAPITAIDSANIATRMGGTRPKEADEIMGSISVANSDAADVTSARKSVESANRNVAVTAATSLGTNWSQTDTARIGESISDSSNTNSGQSNQLLYQGARQFADAHKLGNQISVGDLATAQVTAGLGGAGAKAAVQRVFEEKFGESRGKELATAFMQTFGEGTQRSTALANALSSDIQHGKDTVFGKAEQVSKAEGVNDAVSEAKQKEESYGETWKSATQRQDARKVKYGQLLDAIHKRPDIAGMLESATRTDEGSVQALMQQNRRAMETLGINNRDDQRHIAQLETLAGNNPFAFTTDRVAGTNALAKIAHAAYGMPYQEMASPQMNRNVAGDVTPGEATSKAADLHREADSRERIIDSKREVATEDASHGRERVQARNTENNAEFDEKRAAANKVEAGVALSRASTNLGNLMNTMGTEAERKLKKLGDIFDRPLMARDFSVEGLSKTSRYRDAYNAAKSSGMTETQARALGWRSALPTGSDLEDKRYRENPQFAGYYDELDRRMASVNSEMSQAIQRSTGMPDRRDDADTFQRTLARLGQTSQSEIEKRAPFFKEMNQAVGLRGDGQRIDHNAVHMPGNWKKTPENLQPIILAAAQEANVSPTLLANLINQESSFQNKPPNSVGATGYGQMKPGTFEDMASKHKIKGNITDQNANIRAAAWYLREQLGRYDGNVMHAVGAYNSGPEAYDKIRVGAMKRGKENETHVRNITGLDPDLAHGHNLQGNYSFGRREWDSHFGNAAPAAAAINGADAPNAGGRQATAPATSEGSFPGRQFAEAPKDPAVGGGSMAPSGPTGRAGESTRQPSVTSVPDAAAPPTGVAPTTGAPPALSAAKGR